MTFHNHIRWMFFSFLWWVQNGFSTPYWAKAPDFGGKSWQPWICHCGRVNPLRWLIRRPQQEPQAPTWHSFEHTCPRCGWYEVYPVEELFEFGDDAH